MSEPEMKVLIDRLQRANRRWKVFALSSASVLAILLVAAGASSVIRWNRLAAEREIALQMQQEAMAQRDRAEQLQREAEEAAEEARKAEEKARKEAEKAKNQEQQSKDEVRRMLYLMNIRLAQQQFNQRGAAN
jgi:hypothetical protein